MRELVLHCLEAQAEALSDALIDAGALSVSVEDADGDTEVERPLFGEPGFEPDVQAWQRNRLVALIADGDDPGFVLEQAMAQSGMPPPARQDWILRDVPDADWVRLTQSQFGPIQVGSRICIVPSWHQDDPPVSAATAGPSDAGAPIRIQLDPGLAFGTGSHPTTHLCLAWLADHLQPGDTVLDYGCGSGILAIAAKLLGAGATKAVDIDEQAVQATLYNARVNKVDIDARLPDGAEHAQTQVVVANILSSPLKVLAPMLANRVLAGGHLVLSGVLERQAQDVAGAYGPWLAMTVWRAQSGWVCLHGQKN
jgi:ribosomal protein L11 methyltransferase